MIYGWYLIQQIFGGTGSDWCFGLICYLLISLASTLVLYVIAMRSPQLGQDFELKE